MGDRPQKFHRRGSHFGIVGRDFFQRDLRGGILGEQGARFRVVVEMVHQQRAHTFCEQSGCVDAARRA